MSLWTRAICPNGCGFVLMHCQCKKVYCECDYGGSPSAHHDNCNSCHKKIKTIYEKYDEALKEIARLKAQLKLAEDEVISRGENYNQSKAQNEVRETASGVSVTKFNAELVKKELEKVKVKRKGFFENIHVYYGPEWDKDNEQVRLV